MVLQGRRKGSLCCCASGACLALVTFFLLGLARPPSLASLFFGWSSASAKVLVPGTVDKLSKAGEGIVVLTATEDKRSGGDGHWMESMFHAQAAAGLSGANEGIGCLDVHVGTVGAGKSRGNHRHHNKNETIVIWGAGGVVRVERPGGYDDYRLEPTTRVLVASPAGLGHAIKADPGGADLNLVACADAAWDDANPATDYKVWKDW